MALFSAQRPSSFAALLFTLVIALLSTTARSEQDDTPKPIATSQNAKNFPDLPVLGYVTPWHPRGKELVEAHRQKFDMVSPVWYTVHALGGAAGGYEVRGGPPSRDDEAWYQRLQQPSTTTTALKPVQVVPRFMLDGWGQAEYQHFVFNESNWALLAAAVLAVVTERGYDGVVLEAGAAHALPRTLAALADALHAAGKVLVVVVQPLRTAGATFDALAGNQPAVIEATNLMILQALPHLALVADYFSIMTYDMTGPGGRRVGRRDILNEQMAEAAAVHDIREPGPNTNADWVRENLVQFIEATDPAMLGGDQAAAAAQQFRLSLEALQASRKFLMGVPMYGYKYPVVWADKVKGEFFDPTPTIALHEHAMMTGLAAVRTRPKIPESAKAIMRDAGEAVTAAQIAELIEEHQPEIFKLGDEGEYYFDYQQPTRDSAWTRVFLPTGQSITNVLKTIQNLVEDDLMYSFGGAGVALWEVGQSTDELLAAL